MLEGKTTSYYIDKYDRDKPLPFHVTLQDFNLKIYDGTARPSDFSSRIAITLPDGKVEFSTINVNNPLTTPYGTVYQKACGVEVQNDSLIVLDVQDRGINQHYDFRLGETVRLPSGRLLTVVDFSPSLGYKDGQFFTLTDELMSNPAYLTVLSQGMTDTSKWILGRTNALFVDDLILTFKDFQGVEYSVLEFVHSPFQNGVYAGFLLVVLGFGLLLFNNHKVWLWKAS